MKLEGKLAFRHSNIGLEPESEAIVFIDDEQISDGFKLQNQKVKQYENEVPAILENKEQGLDSSKYDMESANCMKNEYESKVRESVGPVSHSSKDIESLVKFPNGIESVKRSPTSPISNLAEGIDSPRSSVDGYMDKTVTECEPHLEVLCKESNYHAVKDICIDEGVLHKDKVVFVNTIDEKAHNLLASEVNKENQKEKDNTCINVLGLTATVEFDKVSINHDLPKDLMQKDKGPTEKNSDKLNKETPFQEDKVLLQDLLTKDSVFSDDKCNQISNEPELQSQLEESKDIVEEATLTSNCLTLAKDESDNDVLENASFTHQLDPSAPADCRKQECHQTDYCKCEKTQQVSKSVEGKSNDQAVTSHICHSIGESSFSTIGPVSGRISYSGSVPYSGSISLRSDSSTTSTRSFAFPIIQSEWTSSPVRMANADRRRYRKRLSWRGSFFCCKF